MFRLPIDDPQPSQGEWIILDGHTRGVLAVFAGEDELRLTEDTDGDHPQLYRECVSWCRTEGITSVSDLVGRIVDHDTYESEWIDRCHRVAERLGE